MKYNTAAVHLFPTGAYVLPQQNTVEVDWENEVVWRQI